MILTLITASLESAINPLLSLDPEVADEIFLLHGKVLRLDFTDMSLTVYVHIREQSIALTENFEGNPDAVVKGRSSKLLSSYVKGHAVGQGVEVIGDVEFVETFNKLLQKYNIDFEELLSHIVGDAVAYKVHGGFDSVLAWGKDSVRRMGMDLSEYIQEEAKLAPPREELEDFYADIAILRDDVDRAEAKINRLQKKSEGRSDG